MRLNYVEEMQKEMQLILKKLKPHFRGFSLEIENNYIVIKDIDCSYRLVTFGIFGIDNLNNSTYRELELNAEDVFEEVGENLTELKIKPAPPFDINEWKVGFAKRHNLIFKDKEVANKRGDTIVGKANNTSYSSWHKSLFINKHKKFNLSRFSNVVHLAKEEDCEEFERIYTIIIDYLKNMPDLNKEENNEDE